MAFDRTGKDEHYFSGFASLHRAITQGFDRMERRLVAVEQRFQTQILDVRNDVAWLETRMLRRFEEVDAPFDAVDARFDRLEIRVTLIEERIV